MIISVTTTRVTPEQAEKVESFLREFLPRMKREPGVLAIYHYQRPEAGEESTLVIWKDADAIRAYREGELIKEAIAVERSLGLATTTTRESYPLLAHY